MCDQEKAVTANFEPRDAEERFDRFEDIQDEGQQCVFTDAEVHKPVRSIIAIARRTMSPRLGSHCPRASQHLPMLEIMLGSLYSQLKIEVDTSHWEAA